ncbi:MAG: metallophosphoesterase [Oscillospiraceae bacterium]|nr:metallophosphoesterase [Oscillospiraceae bacterium]
MIYITGDMHGDYKCFEQRGIKRKLKQGDILIVCGDFGFIWDGSEEENKRLDKIGDFAFDILFIDGKHENFDLLKNFEEVFLHFGRARYIRKNLFHLIRGEVYKIENENFFVFGGGESRDRDVRLELGRWWKEEMPTFEEISNAAQRLNEIHRKVDYVITHEPPSYIKNAANKNIIETNFLNTFFDSISKEVEFKKWFFGSLHLDKKITNRHIGVFDSVIPIPQTLPQRGFFKRRQR